MATRTAEQQPSPLGRVTLVTGPEELLNERVVTRLAAAVARADPEAEHSATTGDQLSGSTWGELSAPSLFSSTRCIVVRKVEDVPDDMHDALVAYAAATEPDIALVLVHSGGQRGTGLLNRLRKLDSVEEHKSVAVKGRQLIEFVMVEARERGARIDGDAASALVDSIGEKNLRGLAAAVDQLSHDFPGEPLTLQLVRRYFSGRADVKGFQIADDVLNGRTAAALQELRWALGIGVAGPAITGSFATTVRGLARYVAAPRGLREADLAREIGVPPWKLKSLRQQSRAWSPAGLAAAIRAVARADAEVKGAGADEAYSLERMILAVGAARSPS